MKIKDYIIEPHYPCFETILLVLSNNRIDENKITDTLFSGIKKLGDHIGLKIKRADSLFSYLARAEDELYDLVTYATLYLLTNDKKTKDELYTSMKEIISKTNPKEITSFFMELDKMSFGFTSMFRGIFLSLFGIEITAYYNWIDDISYLKKELKNMRVVLTRMSAPEELVNSLTDFETRINKLEMHEDAGGGGMSGGSVGTGGEVGAGVAAPTTTSNIAKYYSKLGTPVRRRKKKKINLKKLLG